MIDNNVSGFSMSPDPEKYAKKIIEIVNDRRLENLRQKSRKHYQSNYSKEIVEQKIISLFSQC
jgi:glycosyltransferase involved in cell wall biosynthesis